MESFEHQNMKFEKKPTIPEISTALSDVFNGNDIKSQEIINGIKEIYFLINLIITHTSHELKARLFLGPCKESEIFNFIEDLRQEYTQEKYSKDIVNEILDSYLKIFRRGGEDTINQWREIIKNYNPTRIDKFKKS